VTTTKEGTYSHAQVELLIGLRSSRAERITIIDIMSLINDAGGDAVWASFAKENYPQEAWMAKRGPLSPDSKLACVYYDFRRAMRKLTLYEQGVIALAVMGFNKTDIAALFDCNTREVHRVLYGRAKRDEDGKLVRNDNGKPMYADGAVTKIVKGMNGRPV
jgi:hypothetical protein